MHFDGSSVLRIVGAGPGDSELISIKGLRAIESADVLLYDALVNESLLNAAKKNCKIVYVGKRKGKKEFSQEEINQLLVFYTARYKNVVRLKGGDPYIFGRGHEELAYARKRGLHVEVIPGISSSIAAPSSVGIPLTKRGINESFWVITGMLASGEFSGDLHLAAQSSATVVVLMGMTHLREIMNVFAKHRSEHEPAAVIQNATLPDQKVVVGTTGNLAALVQQQIIGSPGVIVIGQVVNECRIAEILNHKGINVKAAV